MKKFFHGLSLALLILSVLTLAMAEPAPEIPVTTVHPADTGEALVNPDMGWTLMFYSNDLSNYGSKLAAADTVDDFPGLSTVYLRVPWVLLEPQEGQFNWAAFDTPAQRWIARGKRVALRVTCSENGVRFATPEWVKQAGARGVFYHFGKELATDESGCWDPDFGDPVFLAKLESFLAAAGARYANNPRVAFVDLGSYGLWGEGHTFMSSHVPDERRLPILRQHIDLYRRYFPNTLLAINDDMAGPTAAGKSFPETDYALSRGMTLRDDSILVQPPPHSWYHAELAQSFWPQTPVILEHEHYGISKLRGAWSGDLLAKAVEDYHASYLSIHWFPREELAENRDTVERINRRLGYRLQLRELTWPQRIVRRQLFEVRSMWANAGVAPCYPGGFVTLTLKDAQGGLAAVLSDETLDLRTLAVGPAEAAPTTAHTARLVVGVLAPALAPGKYALFVSVGARDGTPQIALPLAEDDGQHRYRLGEIEVADSTP